jgi:hypothetical protein
MWLFKLAHLIFRQKLLLNHQIPQGLGFSMWKEHPDI